MVSRCAASRRGPACQTRISPIIDANSYTPPSCALENMTGHECHTDCERRLRRRIAVNDRVVAAQSMGFVQEKLPTHDPNLPQASAQMVFQMRNQPCNLRLPILGHRFCFRAYVSRDRRILFFRNIQRYQSAGLFLTAVAFYPNPQSCHAHPHIPFFIYKETWFTRMRRRLPTQAPSVVAK